jgi:hypothetical protein
MQLSSGHLPKKIIFTFFPFLWYYFVSDIFFLQVLKRFYANFICTAKGFPVYLLLNLGSSFFDLHLSRFVDFKELLKNLREQVHKSTTNWYAYLFVVRNMSTKLCDYERNHSQMPQVCYLSSYERMRRVDNHVVTTTPLKGIHLRGHAGELYQTTF